LENVDAFLAREWAEWTIGDDLSDRVGSDLAARSFTTDLANIGMSTAIDAPAWRARFTSIVPPIGLFTVQSLGHIQGCLELSRSFGTAEEQARRNPVT
jgi:hypothetical protein